MNTYLVPTILYVVAIVFGVFWVWICGGFEKHKVRRREQLIEFNRDYVCEDGSWCCLVRVEGK